MLRTIVLDARLQQKWTLQGRLCGVWAADLRRRWEQARPTRAGRVCVVDLEDVISVDAEGENVLRRMAAEGARMLARRAYMKSILSALKRELK
ncbi:hypothetical protein [Paludibaculum fermentans]|uniref:hypothetical protein n=1 Tax=Paludibaculum fermentans TaxID=1473598 RepID=UPI003EBC7BBE